MYMPYHEYQFIQDALYLGIAVGLIIGLLIMAVFYIFEAIGLYQLSKRRGYRSPWIAFIPVVNNYVLGGVADNINVRYGRQSYWRSGLLIAGILNFISKTVYLTYIITQLDDFIFAIEYASPYTLGTIVGKWIAMGIISSMISIGFLVVQAICLYKVYKDYAPKNAVVFLVLGLLFGIAPFFLFAIREKPSVSMGGSPYGSGPQAPGQNGGYNPNGPGPNGYTPNSYDPRSYAPSAPANPQYPYGQGQQPPYPGQSGYNPNGYNPNGPSPNGPSPNGYAPGGYPPTGSSNQPQDPPKPPDTPQQ